MLLAYKPFLLDMASEKLFFSNHPNICLRPKQIFQMGCEVHPIPDEDCSCGIVSYFKYKNYRMADIRTALDSGTMVPFLALIQILGKTVFQTEEQLFRSYEAYLWGFVFPDDLVFPYGVWEMRKVRWRGNDIDYKEKLRRVEMEYDLVPYNLEEADADIKYYWEDWRKDD